MSLVAVARSKLVAGVEAPGFRGLTYDWRVVALDPKNPDPANTKKIKGDLEVTDLGNALEQAWKEDAHFVTYVVRQGGAPLLRQPRVNKGGVAWLREQGFELSAEVLVADVDNPGHAPWTPELRAELEHARAKAALATAGVYLTAHGWRVVQPLARPLPVEAFEAALRGWLVELEAEGIAIDWACADWTRMFRLPRVRRDGRAQKGELLLERMRPIDPPAVKAQARAGRAARGKPRRPGGVDVVHELPATWSDRVAPIAAALRIGGYQGQRHEVALALAGALLGRRVPAEYVPAIATAAIAAAGWDAAHHQKSAEDTVHRWASGSAVKGARALGELAPSVLEALDEVLDAGAQRVAAQATPEPTESLDEATTRLEELLDDVPAGLLLVRAQCGLGKTRAAMIAAVRRASTKHRTAGEHSRAPLHSKTAISVPTTKLARELEDKLRALGVDAVRFFGVLSVVGDDGAPVCQFGPAGRALAGGGQSIPWEFCEGRGRDACDLAETCPAYGGRAGPKEARVAVGPHSMLAELEGWCGSTGLLVIDEPPELLVTEVLRAADIASARATLVRFEPRYAAAMAPALAAVEAWLGREPLDYVGAIDEAFEAGVDQDLLEAAFEQTGADTVRDAARNAFKPDHKGSFAPPIKWAELMVARRLPAYAARLGEASRVVGAVWRCLNVDEAVVRVEVRGRDGELALVCTWPDKQLRGALRRDGAVAVLDAGAELHRPVMAKVVGYEPPMHTFAAPDGAPVERVLLRTTSGTRAGWMPGGVLHVGRVAQAVRAAVDWALEHPGPLGIITFIPVELALRAALGQDVRIAWGRARLGVAVLELVKATLEPELARLGGVRLELGHYGAMRGLDGWKDLDALVTLGDPWKNLGDVQHEVDFLGLDGGWEARLEAQARAELEQAHGRLRTVHRTRPARQLHVGALVPYGWPSWATRRPTEGRPVGVAAVGADELRDLVARAGGTGRASDAVEVDRKTMQRYLSGGRGVPPDVVIALRALVASSNTSPGATERPNKETSLLVRAFGRTQNVEQSGSRTGLSVAVEEQHGGEDTREAGGAPRAGARDGGEPQGLRREPRAHGELLRIGRGARAQAPVHGGQGQLLNPEEPPGVANDNSPHDDGPNGGTRPVELDVWCDDEGRGDEGEGGELENPHARIEARRSSAPTAAANFALSRNAA
jgi:hypothetical protein